MSYRKKNPDKEWASWRGSRNLRKRAKGCGYKTLTRNENQGKIEVDENEFFRGQDYEGNDIEHEEEQIDISLGMRKWERN